MKYPEGAVRTTEQMRGLLGKSVYLTLPPEAGRKIPRVSPFIVKLTPVKIEVRYEQGRDQYYLHTTEFVHAAQDYAIATHGDWTVSWGDWPDENMRNYYFANYWHAYAFTLKLPEYVQCC